MADRYGEALAGIYSLLYPPVSRDEIQHVRQLLNADSVLEAGSGDGRLAIPLAQSGLKVIAVDASPAMNQALADRASRLNLLTRIEIIEADLTCHDLAITTSSILCANSTFFMLGTSENQQRFLNNAAQWLTPGGRLILETYNPLSFIPKSTNAQRFAILPDGHSILFDEIATDLIEQQLTLIRQVRGTKTISFIERSRYCSVWELRAMARLAGLVMVDVFSSWSGAALQADSDVVISVFELPQGAS